MKMGLDPSAHKVDEKRGHQHLGGRDRVSSDGLAGSKYRQYDRKETDRASEEYCEPDMQMNFARRPGPGSRGNPKRDGNACEPLKDHQNGKHSIGVVIYFLPLLIKKLFSSHGLQLQPAFCDILRIA